MSSLPPYLSLVALGLFAGACLNEPTSGSATGDSDAPTVVAKLGTPPVEFKESTGAGKSAEAEAKQLFANRCTACHGSGGGGDGPASAGLTPKPRNLKDPEWQKAVTDEHIEKIIQQGGAAVGLSPMMPGNPDLSAKPEIVAALRKLIRSFAK